MTTRRPAAHRPLALPLLLSTLLAAACGDGNVEVERPGEPPTDTMVAGIYVLRSVDGEARPAVVFDGDVSLEEGTFRLRAVATDGVLELVPGGGYRERIRHAVTVDWLPAPAGLWNDQGGWVALGERVSFASAVLQNVRFDGVRGPGRLELARDYLGEGRTAVYRFEKGMIAFRAGGG